MIAELVSEHPPLLLEYVRDHNVRALGDEAARVAGAHSTGTARDNHCSIVETFHDFFSFHCLPPNVVGEVVTAIRPLAVGPRVPPRPVDAIST